MSQLGKRFFEIGRGYENKSDNYSCPYILGVDIKSKSKPFVCATGDFHSDFGAILITGEELISRKWGKHVSKSNCEGFVDELRKAINENESFPQQFILDLIESANR